MSERLSTKSPTFGNINHNVLQSSSRQPIGLVVGRSKFVVKKYLSQGSFGRLYLGVHQDTNQEVAIKMEPIRTEKPLLHLEYGFYRKLQSLHKIVPRIYTFGPCGDWNALVMELLGPNLEKMLELCGGRFSLRTTIQLTIQFILLFRGLHGCGLLYRDTKPANFLLGTPNNSKWWIVHVVGFCKEWRKEDGSHIPYMEHKPYTGTVRYMSINNNMGREQSRRDDLEAVGYMLVYFYKGQLPWQGVTAESMIRKYEKICQIKLNTPLESLCSNMPQEYIYYFRQIRQLGFKDDPDYMALMNPFIQLLARDYGLELNDKVYDWNQSHTIKHANLRHDYYYPPIPNNPNDLNELEQQNQQQQQQIIETQHQQQDMINQLYANIQNQTEGSTGSSSIATATITEPALHRQTSPQTITHLKSQRSHSYKGSQNSPKTNGQQSNSSTTKTGNNSSGGVYLYQQ